MWLELIFRITILLFSTSVTLCQNPNQGLGEVSHSQRVKAGVSKKAPGISFMRVRDLEVNPVCGQKYMTVQLTFDRNLQNGFTDWIVVGRTNREQCRLQGNGQTEYIIEIPVMNDPCGTKMLENSGGTFENVIRIAQNPLVILHGDETVTVRCLYGLPKIGTPFIPSLIYTDPESIDQPSTIGPPIESLQDDINNRRPRKVNVAIVYLIIFPILLLALIFLFVGCLYFCLKRRKVRLERRKQLLVAPPPGSELSKLGLSHLWWSGKGSIANDALLSHDYMISSNSTREGLSVSTEYGGLSTPSSDSGGSTHNHNNRPPAPTTPVDEPSTSYNNNSYVHDANHIGGMANSNRRPGPAVNSLQRIPEENQQRVNKAEPKSYSEWRNEMITQQQQTIENGATALYAHVEKTHKSRQVGSGLDLDDVEMGGGHAGATTSQLCSISEIYASADVPNRDDKSGEDNSSVSTLEGKQYKIDQTTVVRADVHAAAVRSALREKPEWLEPFIEAVEQHRGLGARKLTEQEIGRWRTLLETDKNLQQILRQCSSVDDYEMISHLPEYQHFYSPEKWLLITQSLARVKLVTKLTQMLDQENDNDSLDENDVKRRYMKKSDGVLPRKAGPEDHIHQDERLFTRDSYNRVKEQITSNENLEKMEQRKRSTEADMCMTEVVEGVPTISARRNEVTPNNTLDTLNVYVGNVPVRHVARNKTKPQYDSTSSYGATAYDNWQTNPDEL